MKPKQNPKENEKNKSKIDPEVQKKYDALSKRADSLQNNLSKCKDERTAVELLYKMKMMSEKAYKAAIVYLKKKANGVTKTLSNEPLETGLEGGIKSYVNQLNDWCNFVKYNGASQETLTKSEIIWDSKIKKEQHFSEEKIQRGLKIQSYFSFKALHDIRYKVVIELNKRFPGWRGGLGNPDFSNVDKKKVVKLIGMLNIQLADLFRLNSMSEEFLNSLPALIDNEIDLNAVFNHEDVQDRFNELIAKNKDYLDLFKPAGSDKPEPKDKSLPDRRPYTGGVSTMPMSGRTPEDLRLRLDDARSNLESHGFSFGKDGHLYDEDGNRIGSDVTGEELNDGILEISAHIDQHGIETTMIALKKMREEQFDIKGEIDYLQQKDIKVSKEDLKQRITGDDLEEILKLFEDAGVVEED